MLFARAGRDRAGARRNENNIIKITHKMLDQKIIQRLIMPYFAILRLGPRRRRPDCRRHPCPRSMGERGPRAPSTNIADRIFDFVKIPICYVRRPSRGWQDTLSDPHRDFSAPRGFPRAPMDGQGRPVSSISRSQTAVLQQCSASLSIMIEAGCTRQKTCGPSQAGRASRWCARASSTPDTSRDQAIYNML